MHIWLLEKNWLVFINALNIQCALWLMKELKDMRDIFERFKICSNVEIQDMTNWLKSAGKNI